MTTVKTCSTLPEAQVIQSILAGSGINSFLPDEFTIQTDWMWSNAIGGVRIQVADEDVEKTAEVLNINSLPIAVEAKKSCPICGETLRETHGLGFYPKCFLTLLLSMPLRSKSSWRCPKCGTVPDLKSR